MCIIVYKSKGKKLDKNVLRICHENNNQGMGFMYASHNKVIIRKHLTDFDKLWKVYEDNIISKNRELSLPVVWHFRIRTHGEISLANCHPFHTKDGIGFCHNGLFSKIDIPEGSPDSDTLTFKKQVLDKLPTRWIGNKVIKFLIASYIGYNKLLFLKPSGDVITFNGKMWDEDDKGILYSNASYRRTRTNITSTDFSDFVTFYDHTSHVYFTVPKSQEHLYSDRSKYIKKSYSERKYCTTNKTVHATPVHQNPITVKEKLNTIDGAEAATWIWPFMVKGVNEVGWIFEDYGIRKKITEYKDKLKDGTGLDGKQTIVQAIKQRTTQTEENKKTKVVYHGKSVICVRCNMPMFREDEMKTGICKYCEMREDAYSDYLS